jgi:hypothetical protein
VTENEITNRVIGVAIEIHKALGPGLLESAYKECMYHKIGKSGLRIEKEKSMPLKLGNYKLGLLINFNVVLLKDGIKRVINGIL